MTFSPAAADTLRRYFSAVGTVPADYDLILTGDLGREGSGILLELMRACGYELSPVHADAGLLIYGDTGDKHAGGSGCGCSASVMAAYVLPLMKGGSYKNVLFVGTGALMNPMMLYQGRTIPGIAHLVHLRTEVTCNDR